MKVMFYGGSTADEGTEVLGYTETKEAVFRLSRAVCSAVELAEFRPHQAPCL